MTTRSGSPSAHAAADLAQGRGQKATFWEENPRRSPFTVASAPQKGSLRSAEKKEEGFSKGFSEEDPSPEKKNHIFKPPSQAHFRFADMLRAQDRDLAHEHPDPF